MFRFYVNMPILVTISQPSGVPGEHYNISIDSYYYGTVVKRDGKWESHLNPNAEKKLSRDDVQAICDWIDEAFPD
jgi:hypothetical protein